MRGISQVRCVQRAFSFASFPEEGKPTKLSYQNFSSILYEILKFFSSSLPQFEVEGLDCSICHCICVSWESGVHWCSEMLWWWPNIVADGWNLRKKMYWLQLWFCAHRSPDFFSTPLSSSFDAAVYQFHLFCSFCLPACRVLCVFWLCSSLDLPPTERFRIWELKRIASSMVMNLRQSLMTGVCLSLLSVSICISHSKPWRTRCTYLSVLLISLCGMVEDLKGGEEVAHLAYKFSLPKRRICIFVWHFITY